jgi:hypothetical protein
MGPKGNPISRRTGGQTVGRKINSTQMNIREVYFQDILAFYKCSIIIIIIIIIINDFTTFIGLSPSF